MNRRTGDFTLVRASRDAVPASLRRLYHRLRPRRRVPIRALVLAAAVVVTVGALAWVVYGTPVLGVRQVEVSGAQLVGAEQVRTAAAVPLGTPLARVDTDAVAHRVQELAPVARARVSRSWPGTLVIAVTERSAVAVVAAPDGFVELDSAGVLFHTVANPPAGLALLRVSAPGPGDPSTLAALRVLGALTPQLRAQLVAISAPTPGGIRVELAGGRVVVWGSAEQSDVKARVATTLLARPGRTIDVSAPDVATTTP